MKIAIYSDGSVEYKDYKGEKPSRAQWIAASTSVSDNVDACWIIWKKYNGHLERRKQ